MTEEEPGLLKFECLKISRTHILPSAQKKSTILSIIHSFTLCIAGFVCGEDDQSDSEDSDTD